jgi:tetratricopeptide (TPR) repeat protein
MKQLKQILILLLIGSLTLGSAVCLASKSKAEKFYEQAEGYATEGKWDLAADTFEQAVKEYAKYKDVQERLEDAKTRAAGMLIHLGDDAKAQENYEDALTYYQKALHYKPASAEAKARADKLAQDMVAVFYTRGKNYEVQNKLPEALKEYEKGYAINPSYQDLGDRYRRVKAKLQGETPIVAVLFFLNQSEQLDIENPFTNAFLTELTLAAKDKLVLIDYRKVQAILKEQAAGLGENLNTRVAMDIGRMVGADQVIVGDFQSEGRKSDKLEITAKLLKVPQADQIKQEKVSFKFDNPEELKKELNEAARKLARKMAD